LDLPFVRGWYPIGGFLIELLITDPENKKNKEKKKRKQILGNEKSE